MIAAAKESGWRVNQFKHALTTKSIYVELQRQDEYVVIRVSDHKQVFHHWITTYSLAPGDMFHEQIVALLKKPYGEVGVIIPPP